MKRIFLVLPICLFLCGCLTYQKYSYKFDYTTGRVERLYYDIRSQDGKGEKNYSIEADWELLQTRIGKEFEKEFDPDVIKPVKAELFEDGEVLSGKEIFEVQLPKAFPSKKAILERLHADQDEKPEFQVINGEIFLFAGKGEIESANGKIIKTGKNNMVVWPEDQLVFEYTLNRNNIGGISLLPLFLKEKKVEEKKTDE